MDVIIVENNRLADRFQIKTVKLKPTQFVKLEVQNN